MNDFRNMNETIKDAGFSRSRLAKGGDDQRLGILYENDAWLGDLFDELARRSIAYTAIRMDDAALMLEQPPAYPVVFNRVSPSSYLRGHGPAIPYARSMLELLSAEGRRVINGAVSFSLETSKFAQLLLFKRLGVCAPRSILFNNRKQIAQLARDFPFPAILKPNCGGSGALIRLIESYEHLVSLLEGDLNLFGPDHLLLLQERLVADDGAVIRAEFIDGQFVYAMRVRATNTFNLCPADSCVRQVADPMSGDQPRVEFEPYPDIAPAAVAQARRIVTAAKLEVGGVEFVESGNGTAWFYDINATSIYRRDIADAVEVDAMGKLVDFIERELRKEFLGRSLPAGKASDAGLPDGAAKAADGSTRTRRVVIARRVGSPYVE